MEQLPFCTTDYTPANDAPGRVLSDAEYAEAVRARPDIFQAEKSSRLIIIQAICMTAAAAVIVIMSNSVPAHYTATDFSADFYEKMPVERFTDGPCSFTPCDWHQMKIVEKREFEEEAPTDRKTLKPAKSYGVTPAPSGGDPRDRVSQMGILGKLTGQANGKGGFATDIDVILSGADGLKAIGSSGGGRKGAAGVDPNANYSSNPGAKITNDTLGGFMMPPDGKIIKLLKRRGAAAAVHASPYTHDRYYDSDGRRSDENIRKTVMRCMTAVRRVYAGRLLDKPQLRGAG